MAEPLVSDELWAVLEPMIPKHQTSPKGGRPRIDNRKALTGILFVLKSGIPWEMLPQEMGCGVYRWVSGRTLGWLYNFRRLRVRFDRSPDIYHVFLKIAESLICFRTMQSGFC